MARDSFTFKREWLTAIADLPRDMRLDILEAAIQYATTGEEVELSPMASLAFSFIRQAVDTENDKIKEISKKRATAAKKRTPKDSDKQMQQLQQMQQMQQLHTKQANAAIAANAANAAIASKTQYPLNVDTVVIDVDNNNIINNNIEIIKKKESKEKKESSPTELMEKRMAVFLDSLQPYVGRYPPQLIEAFASYWTEPNKSRTKMRFELERTWDTTRRLATWASKQQSYANHRQITQQQRAESYAGVAAEFLNQARADPAS